MNTTYATTMTTTVSSNNGTISTTIKIIVITIITTPPPSPPYRHYHHHHHHQHSSNTAPPPPPLLWPLPIAGRRLLTLLALRWITYVLPSFLALTLTHIQIPPWLCMTGWVCTTPKQTQTTLAEGLDGPWLPLPRTELGTKLKHRDF